MKNRCLNQSVTNELITVASLKGLNKYGKKDMVRTEAKFCIISGDLEFFQPQS